MPGPNQDWEANVATLEGSVRLPDAVSREFWMWFDQHQGDTVLQKKVLIAKVTVKVKDLKPVFERVFGAHT